MATINFRGSKVVVDHAVKGSDYVHGFDASGKLLVSIEGITDFSCVTYDGTYMSPDKCANEPRNEIRHVNGRFVRRDGTIVSDDNVYDKDAVDEMLSSYAPVTISTTDLTAGTSKLASGSVYFVYE